MYNLQEQSGTRINVETFYFAITMIHQVMLDKFNGDDVSDEQLEAVLSEYVDKLVKQAGWSKNP